ncbi:MAG TPA: prepilin-type N-terminal cleavage/methylation domain-containing protein [Candidatus Eisenbacteria bacterium]|nr:prepilin-type N-terminal cleavage/methylation domain-containing protein [Candidatus Eisenbacteria bacterium]
MSNFKFQILNENPFRHPGKRSASRIRLWTNQNAGFTLIELLLAMSIAAILLGFTTFSLMSAQRSTSAATAEESLIADIKSQQIKAMNGIHGSGNFGIHFTGSNTYTLFQGGSFVGASSTSPVTIDDNISFTCTVGCASGDMVFTKVNGEISSPTTITVVNTAGTESKTIIFNRYGVITAD